MDVNASVILTEKLKRMLGDLVFQVSEYEALIEALKAESAERLVRIAELEKQSEASSNPDK